MTGTFHLFLLIGLFLSPGVFRILKWGENRRKMMAKNKGTLDSIKPILPKATPFVFNVNFSPLFPPFYKE